MSDPQIFRLMHQAHRAMFRAADRTLTMRFDITATQHGVLLYLHEHDGASMGELAGALGLKNAAISGLIDRMQKKRLLHRQPSERDGRSYVVELLPYGKDVIAASKMLIVEANQKLLNGFSETDLNKFGHFLEILRKRADAFEHTQDYSEIETNSGEGHMP